MSDAHSSELKSLVYFGDDAKLAYTVDSGGNRVPDFSRCGYMGGGVKIPDVSVVSTLTPIDGSRDDTARIQSAIDKLSGSRADKNGFRGTLLLKRGVYRVSGTLQIAESGLVLRGEGARAAGTVIIATGTNKRALIQVGSGGPGKEIAGSRSVIADDFVPVGANRLRVEAQHIFRQGDSVVVYSLANSEWIKELGTDKLNRGPSDEVKNWTAAEYGIRYERVVTGISGSTITLDAPIVSAIDKKYGGGCVYKAETDGRIRNVGIETLRLVSEYKQGDKSDEEHGWDGVRINSLSDGWVRNVTAVHFGYSCVNISSRGKNITVQDCACLDPVSKITGGRRYSFALAGQLCLIQRCYTREGRHDYVMHARVPGPNVFLDCVADNPHSDSGPHHRWSTGTLYDNIACGALNVQWRGRSGTGHGWAGANMVFWNCRAASIDCQKPPTANNYCIGCTGKIRGSGYIESKDKSVEPRSLYLKQLSDRLGAAAVRNIATEEQLKGTVDDWLRKRLSE